MIVAAILLFPVLQHDCRAREDVAVNSIPYMAKGSTSLDACVDQSAKCDASHGSQLQPLRFLPVIVTRILWFSKLLSKGLVQDHVIYVFIYLFNASNLFNFIYLKFLCLSYPFLYVTMPMFP